MELPKINQYEYERVGFVIKDFLKSLDVAPKLPSSADYDLPRMTNLKDLRKNYGDLLKTTGLELDWEAIRRDGKRDPELLVSIDRHRQFLSYLKHLEGKDLTQEEANFLQKIMSDIESGIQSYYDLERSDSRLEEFVLSMKEFRDTLFRIDEKSHKEKKLSYKLTEVFDHLLTSYVEAIKGEFPKEFLALEEVELINYPRPEKHEEVPVAVYREPAKKTYLATLAKEFAALEKTSKNPNAKSRKLFTAATKKFKDMLVNDRWHISTLDNPDFQKSKKELIEKIEEYLLKLKDL